MGDEELTIEAFAILAAQADMRIAPEDLALMREGYLGLRALLACLPREPDMFTEPAMTFAPARLGP